MAEISQIRLPNNVVLDLKDATARLLQPESDENVDAMLEEMMLNSAAYYSRGVAGETEYGHSLVQEASP